MRLALRILRDVRLHPVHPWPGLRHRTFGRDTTSPGGCFRTISTGLDVCPAPAAEPTGPPASAYAVYSTGAVDESRARSWGRWRWLSLDVKRLVVETDFERKKAAKRSLWRRPLLVDKLSHRGDFELWSVLLDHLQRLYGDQGVITLWRALWGRKSLYDVQSALAKSFWETILEAVLRTGDEKLLDQVWIFAEWMRDAHQHQWPKLYITVVTHHLRTRQLFRTLNWHLRLCPHFYPASYQFTSMIQHFSTDRLLYAPDLLQALYITSPERGMYDFLVPYLYERGQASLARKWRHTCIHHGDGPVLQASVRPFLRYLRGYSARGDLTAQEATAVDVGADGGDDGEPPGPQNEPLEFSQEYVSRRFGATFGISPKTYNDGLGARWFASSWISVDTAISAILTLGIREIGPMSLQSIALREATPAAVSTRLAQLHDLGISVPDTNYVSTLRYLAQMEDQSLLTLFLKSDIHPEVFDDLALQAAMMESSSKNGDWEVQTVLLAASVANMARSTRVAANAALEAYLQRGDQHGVFRILDDMRAAHVSLNVEIPSRVFQLVHDQIPFRLDLARPPEDLDFYVSLVRRLSFMDIPVPTWCWRRILYALGRLQRVEELEKLCIELVDYYTSRRSMRPGFMPVHLSDTPSSMVSPIQGVRNLMGLYIPLDTPTDSHQHPLALIFDKVVLGALVRWSFRRPLRKIDTHALILRNHQTTPQYRTLRVLRLLKDRGLHVEAGAIRKDIMLRLAELYGEAHPTKKAHFAARRANVLALGHWKEMCDSAWGEPLLPSLREMHAGIGALDQKRLKYRRAFEQRVRAGMLRKPIQR